MEIKRISKKGVEMTMPLLVTIVIGLVILAIILYVLWTRSQTFTESTGCSPENCITSADTSGCPSGYEPGFVTCSEKDNAGKKRTGRCCVQTES
jgi:hypothetical protein